MKLSQNKSKNPRRRYKAPQNAHILPVCSAFSPLCALPGALIFILKWFHVFIIMGIFFISAHAAPLEKTAEKKHGDVVGSVKITVSDKEITIAESISLKIEVKSPNGYTAHLPDFKEYGFSTDFNERSQRFRATDISEIKEKKSDDGTIIYTREFTLEPWLSGNYAILPLMIPFFETKAADDTHEGEEQPSGWEIPAFNVMTEGMRINVKPLSGSRKKLSDLFGQSDYKMEKLTKRVRRKEDKSDDELKTEQEQEKEAFVALKKRSFPWWILWLFLSLFIIAPLVWFFGRKKLSEIFSPKPKPAHEVAYMELEKLRNSNLLMQGKIKEFYYELSYILRKYIGNRYNIYAANQTTEEFFSILLESNPFDKSSEEILHTFSDFADTVKYSLYRPDGKVAEQSYNTAKSFVDDTKLTQEEAS